MSTETEIRSASVHPPASPPTSPPMSSPAAYDREQQIIRGLWSRGLGGATFFCMPGPSDVGGVNLPGLLSLVIVFVAVFLPMLLRPGGRPPEDSGPGPEDGWGKGPGQPRTPPGAPRGGIPLDDAEPARVRLRDQVRLADCLPGRDRRPTRQRERPPQVPARLEGLAVAIECGDAAAAALSLRPRSTSPQQESGCAKVARGRYV